MAALNKTNDAINMVCPDTGKYHCTRMPQTRGNNNRAKGAFFQNAILRMLLIANEVTVVGLL